MKLLHARLRGWTATFRLPMFYTGTGLTAPLPPYSTLLGLLGNLAGRDVGPGETRIGYTFCSSGSDFDLESLQRLKVEKGRLKEQPDRNVAKRQFLVRPQLDLYLDNIAAFAPVLENPLNVPCLGRSQDVAWIEKVEEVEVEPIEEGTIHNTLVPFPQPGASGLILVLPDYFHNADDGHTRTVGRMRQFQVVASPSQVRREGLFQVPSCEHSIYLHQLDGS
jgi:CRISPR-associated protein Cas5t